MKTPKGLKKFMLVNCSQTMSLIGSGLTDFALSFYVLQSVMADGHNLSRYTILYFMIYFPGVLVAPFVGTLVDKYNKKTILVISDTIAMLGSLIVLLIYRGKSLKLYYIYGIVFIKSVASAFQSPAFQSSVSLLVDKEDYGKAIGFSQIGESVNRIISPLIAGLLFYYSSLELIVIIDFVCYAFAMILLCFVKIPNVKESVNDAKEKFIHQCKTGFKVLIKDKLLVNLLLLFVINNFLIAFIEILVQPLVYNLNELGGSTISNSVALGTVMTAGGLGMMIGSIVMGVTGGPKDRINTMLYLNGAGGLVLMLVIVTNSIIVFSLGTFVYFVTIPFILGSNVTIWQERVPIEHQGKVFSLRRACVLSVIPLSSIITGLLVDWLNNNYNQLTLIKSVTNSSSNIYNLLFFVIGLCTVALSILFMMNKSFRKFQKERGGGLENG